MISSDNICKGSLLRNITFDFRGDVLCVLSNREEDIRCLFSILSKSKKPDSGLTALPEGVIPFLPSSGAFPRTLKVSDCLKFVKAMTRTSDAPAIVKELAENIADVRFGNLSPLQALKGAVAALLICSPEYIILEDPAKDLSPSEYGQLSGLLNKLSKHAKIIFSCSVPSVFEEVSDKLLVLSDGKQLEYGDTAEVLKKADSPGMLICRIKGNKEKISEILGFDGISIEDTDRGGICKVTVPETENRRREIKKAVSKAGMALLDIHSDNGTLKSLIRALSDRESELLSEYEDADTDIADELIAFNHDTGYEYDDEDDSEDTDTGTDEESEQNNEASGVKPDIASLLSHGEDDDETSDHGESTLFSTDSEQDK